MQSISSAEILDAINWIRDNEKRRDYPTAREMRDLVKRISAEKIEYYPDVSQQKAELRAKEAANRWALEHSTYDHKIMAMAMSWIVEKNEKKTAHFLHEELPTLKDINTFGTKYADWEGFLEDAVEDPDVPEGLRKMGLKMRERHFERWLRVQEGGKWFLV